MIQLLNKNDIKKDEYFDLTNNNMHYFFTKTIPPFESLAFYNMANENSWKRNFHKISKIRFFLIKGHEVYFDKISPSDRSPSAMEYLINDPQLILKEYGEIAYLIRDQSKVVQSENERSIKEVFLYKTSL